MSLPSYELELRASEQRKRIHVSLDELRSRLHDRAALKPVLRKYLGRLSVGITVLGALAGYGIAGMFTTSRR
jgi:hypothetical protein